ncbi:hypothetical protein ACFFKE_11470 [Streptomyces mutabilis]|uniref:hypothetical protein n=1 Tax=Streptomyces mutabilis TaxID=67332 RepID=UPI00177B2FB8|nr:hypothetical protein [Streptomyces mutabilis]GGQ50101.1 hypothetical protein GCM10010279_69260 [Streptomyces mutabilis]
MSYLEEAAALLRKADKANDAERYPDRETTLRIAGQFVELAAVERGQLPASLVEAILDRIGGTR